MPHVTFIHGISNMPPSEDLLRIWRRALADAAEPLPLGDRGVTSSMVYWADLLNAEPEPNLSAFEGVLENSAEAIDGAGEPEPPVAENEEEARFLEQLRASMTGFSEAELGTGEPPPVPAEPEGALERVPLPWFIKRRFLAAFLRDVHHYLFDTEFAPPGRPPPLPIQKTIRQRFVEALGGDTVSRPHVVVAHSMGTVIAYDCLKRVGDCAGVDGLITIGSPLGLDEVQDKLQPGWSRFDGYPHEKLAAGWVNLYDRLDPVCGLDPLLANDFRRNGFPALDDIGVSNDGVWRHSATKYLRQPAFSAALGRMLEL